MSPLFPELSDELETTAERQVRPRRRWLPVVGAGVAVVAIGGVATAATGVWSPQVGDESRGRPTVSASPVPKVQLDRLAVLRRSQTDADRSPEVRRVLRLVGRSYRGVRTGSMRLVGTADSGAPSRSTILIPAERAEGIDDALCLYVTDRDGAGATCYSTRQILTGRFTSSTVREKPPTAAQKAASRRATDAANRRDDARRRALRERLAPLPKDPRKRARVLEDAYAARGLNGSVYVMVGGPPKAIDTRYYGLVPDGVTRVVRTSATGRHTATVASNHYEIVIPGRDEGRGTTRWLDAEGRVLRTIRR